MFGKKNNRKYAYLQKRLKGIDENDNLIIKSSDNKLSVLSKQSSRPSDNSSIKLDNMKTYISQEGYVDDSGTLLTYNKDNVLFTEDLFLHLVGNITENNIVIDKSGSNLHGTWKNKDNDEQIYDDIYGEIMDFDGTNDYIDIENIIIDYIQGFTFSGWVRFNSIDSEEDIRIFIFNNTTNIIEILNKTLDSKLILKISSNGSEKYRLECNNFLNNENNNFIFISVTFNIINGTNYGKFYKNGIYYPGTLTTNLTISPTNYTATNNYIPRPNAPYFEGQMFDLRFYSRSLTDNEVFQVYNESLNKYNKIIQQSNLDIQLQKDLFLWIKCDEEGINKINNYGYTNVIVSQVNSPSITKSFKNNISSIDFDGSNDYLSIGNTTINYIQGFTFCGWVRFNSIDSEENLRIFVFDNSTNTNRIEIFNKTNNNLLGLKITNNTQKYRLECDNFFTNENNNHLFISLTFIIINGINYGKIFKNGKYYPGNIITDLTISPTSYTATNNYIGRPPVNDNAEYFDGQMFDLRFYSSVLSDSEIKKIYDQSLEKLQVLQTNINISHFSIQNQITNLQPVNLINFNSLHTNKLLLHLSAKDVDTYNNSITDYSGYSHQGSNNNIIREISEIAITDSLSALKFNGSSSYIECSSPTDYDYEFRGISRVDSSTFTTWIYLNLNSQKQPIYSFGNSSEISKLLQIFIDTNGRLSLELGTLIYKFEYIFSANIWYYIVIEIDKNIDNSLLDIRYIKSYYATKTDTILNENKLYEYLNNNLANDSDLFIHLTMDNISGNFTKDISDGDKFNSTINNGGSGLGLSGIGPYGNNVLDFDGTNDYLDLPTISGNYFQSGFTFCGWVRFNDISNRIWERVFDFGVAENDNIELVHNSTTPTLTFQIRNNSTTWTIFNYNNYFSDNEWVFISLTTTSGNNKLYKNGNLISSNNITYTIPNINRTDNYIGRSRFFSSNNDYTLGQMFDLRFYSRILSEYEIKQIYEQGNRINTNSNPTSSSSYLRIGREISTSFTTDSNYFNGLMDDIRIYQRALTKQELEFIWNSGDGSYIYGSNLNNSTMIKYITGNNLILNSRVLCQITYETLFDSNRAILEDNDLFIWLRGDDGISDRIYDFKNNINYHMNNDASDNFINLFNKEKYKLSQCLDFDGTNDYIELGSLSTDVIKQNGFTFTGWLNFNTISNFNPIFQFHSNEGAQDLELTLYYYDTDLVLSASYWFYMDGARFLFSSMELKVDNYISSNEWVFISVTMQPSSAGSENFEAKIYKNSTLKNIKSDFNNTKLNIYNIFNICRIGATYNISNDINGQMSDLRFYSRVLTPEEIRKQYLDKVTNGYLLNESKTDQHSFRIMDYTHNISDISTRVSGILEPLVYNFGSNEDKLSSSMWIYPEYQQSGTLISNSRGSSSLQSGDWAFSIEPIRYEDMFLWITGNDVELSPTSTSVTISNIYNSSDNIISINPINSPKLSTGIFRNNIFNFDGTNDYLDIGDISGNYFQNAFTFCGWVRFNDISNRNSERVFDFGLGQSNNNIILAHEGTTTELRFRIYNGGLNQNILVFSNYFTNNEWVFISLTSTSGNNNLYKNGNLILSNNTIYTLPNINRTSNYIGKSNWSVDPNTLGEMFDLRFYSRILSTDEIKQIYNRTQNLVFKYHNGTSLQYKTSKIPISLKEWTHVAFNYSKTDDIIELYQNSQLVDKWNITGLPSLNTNSPIIGAMQYSNLNRNVFQGEICDLIIKPDITYVETLNSIYNMENKIVLDLQILNSGYNNTILQLYDNLIYDASFIPSYNIQNNTENLLGHTIDYINIANILPEYNGMQNVLHFNNANQYIKLSGSLSKNPIYNFTISFWIYPESGHSEQYGYIISKWGVSVGIKVFAVLYDYINSELIFRYRVFNNTSNNIETKLDMNKDEWYFVTITYINKEGFYIYINGELKIFKHNLNEITDMRYNSSGNTLYTEEGIYIGNNISSLSTDYLYGYLKDIKVYYGVLSQKSIKESYQKIKNLSLSTTLTYSTETKSSTSTSTSINSKQPSIDITSNLIINLDASIITNINISTSNLIDEYMLDTSKNKFLLDVPNPSNIYISNGFNDNYTSNSSLYLDNTQTTNNAYIYNNSTPTLLNNNISVSFWIKYISTNGIKTLFRNGATSSGYGLIIDGSEIKLVNSTSTISCSPSIVNIPNNIWTHIAYTCDSGINNLYINNTHYVFTSNNNLNIPQSVFSIGADITETINSSTYSTVISNKLTGNIQDFKMYDRVITIDEIKNLSLKNTSFYNYISSDITIDNKSINNSILKVFTSKYSKDSNLVLDVPLPFISRDNLLVHYNPDNYLGNGIALNDSNSEHKSKYLYNNVSFTGIYHGEINYDAILSHSSIISLESGIINNSSFYFNGSNNYISVTEGANLNTNSGNEWSISCWIKPENLNKNNNNVIWCKTDNGSYTTGAIRCKIDSNNNNKLFLEISNGSSYDTKVVIVENEWLLITTTFGQEGYTSNVLTQYINNTIVYRAINDSISISSPNNTDIIRFGSDTSSANFLSGYMDNILIWYTRLHDGEIERLYNRKQTEGPLHHWIVDNTINSSNNIIGDLGFGNSKLNMSEATITSTISKINNSVFHFNNSYVYLDTFYNGIGYNSSTSTNLDNLEGYKFTFIPNPNNSSEIGVLKSFISTWNQSSIPSSSIDTYEISQTLTMNDDQSISISLSNSFTYFGITYTTIYINSNGSLNFSNFSSYSDSLTSLWSNKMIAFLWDDLNPTLDTSEIIRYGYLSETNTNDVLVVTFANVSEYGNVGNKNNIEIYIYLNNHTNKAGYIVIYYGLLQLSNESFTIGVSNGIIGEVIDLPNGIFIFVRSEINIQSSLVQHCKSSTLGILRDNARTYSFWIYSTSQSYTIEKTLFDLGDTTIGNRFRISINTDNKLQIDLGTTTLNSNDTLTINEWYHICILILPRSFHSSSGNGNDNNIRIFINGKYSTDTSTYNNTIINTTITSPTNDNIGMYIGSNYNKDAYFAGYMDDIRIYKVALSYDEINNLYTNSRNYKMLLLS